MLEVRLSFLFPENPSKTPVIPQPPVEDPNKPVKMYISPDVRPNPPPTTIDGKYVADHLGNALTLALSDISERRPWDPIEYLANWLYKYQANVDYNKHVSTLIQTTNITNHAYSMYRVMITHST